MPESIVDFGIEEWLPTNVVYNSNATYRLVSGTQFGVYQALSTRAGGEVISPDSY